jgi:hypothetical protein
MLYSGENKISTTKSSSSVYAEEKHEHFHHHQTSSMTTSGNYAHIRSLNHPPSLYKEPESDLCRRCHKFVYPMGTFFILNQISLENPNI